MKNTVVLFVVLMLGAACGWGGATLECTRPVQKKLAATSAELALAKRAREKVCAGVRDSFTEIAIGRIFPMVEATLAASQLAGPARFCAVDRPALTAIERLTQDLMGCELAACRETAKAILAHLPP